MLVGIIIGIVFVICIILAFMAGYGVADMKHKSLIEEEID
jgi:hypothetical protein